MGNNSSLQDLRMEEFFKRNKTQVSQKMNQADSTDNTSNTDNTNNNNNTNTFNLNTLNTNNRLNISRNNFFLPSSNNPHYNMPRQFLLG
ncbi:hypothetical protein M0813_25952 [Anaeramoeba flamelloides]|uniref:Uncharacterized protein n=1 Tax=Anaeramoeba flamelloides TaxID=1746091 RepID=A0ABQ8Y3F1_9EUKA|nr:hypothetical protein M0813_25952 [Anaeramoeba flamelloides]